MDEVVIVNGMSIAYQVEGQGEPVILLHGNGLSGGLWKYNIGPLSPRYQVFAPDLPGFGRSDKPDADYGVEYYVEFLKSFMDALQIRKAALVGHSFLGVVAATFAVRCPDRVTKLVLADACSVISMSSPVYKAALKVGLWSMARSRKMFTRQLLYDGALDSRLDGVWLLPDSKDSRRAFSRNCRRDTGPQRRLLLAPRAGPFADAGAGRQLRPAGAPEGDQEIRRTHPGLANGLLRKVCPPAQHRESR